MKKFEYKSPVLTRFGPVAALTRGAPGTRVDGMSGNNATGNQGQA